jgi:hypothetical protein
MNPMPAIVVVAYDRPRCLDRLLKSIAVAQYNYNDITLIISIDKSKSAEVIEIANVFKWEHGLKKVIIQEEHLGLKDHIIKCGDLTTEYGNIIILEDDLIVSPLYYEFSVNASNYYWQDENIAGISLYSYHITENGFYPFYPHDDGYDVYFMQLPSSWGQIFNVNQWRGFKSWYESNTDPEKDSVLPDYIDQWSIHSWKKKFAEYLINTNKYFVYPRLSYSTNYGDPGVNTDRKGLFQVVLVYAKRKLNFVSLDRSCAIYDSWFEIAPQCLKQLYPYLKDFDFTVDLHGTKAQKDIRNEYLLSCKSCIAPILTFGNNLPEPVQNLIVNDTGNFYAFGLAKDFGKSKNYLADFYTTIKPIQDIFMLKYMDEFVEEFNYNIRFPKIWIGIVDNERHKIEETLKSIYLQQYPQQQVTVSIFRAADSLSINQGENVITYKNDNEFTETVIRAIETSNAEYFVLIKDGDTLSNDALNEVNKIFSRYRDIAWLSGIEEISCANGQEIFSQNIAERRWSARIFELSRCVNTKRYIPWASTFWKRYAWENAKKHINTGPKDGLYLELCSAFFKTVKLYSCDIKLSVTKEENIVFHHKGSTLSSPVYVERKPMYQLYEYFFIKNCRFIRDYYKELNNLPENIYLDTASGWYYQKDY